MDKEFSPLGLIKKIIDIIQNNPAQNNSFVINLDGLDWNERGYCPLEYRRVLYALPYLINTDTHIRIEGAFLNGDYHIWPLEKPLFE